VPGHVDGVIARKDQSAAGVAVKGHQIGENTRYADGGCQELQVPGRRRLGPWEKLRLDC
jgi:hypothetical protein